MSCSSERIGRLRAALAAEGIRSMLVRDTPNIRWLTALDGVFDEEGAHALLVPPIPAMTRPPAPRPGARGRRSR